MLVGFSIPENSFGRQERIISCRGAAALGSHTQWLTQKHRTLRGSRQPDAVIVGNSIANGALIDFPVLAITFSAFPALCSVVLSLGYPPPGGYLGRKLN